MKKTDLFISYDVFVSCEPESVTKRKKAEFFFMSKDLQNDGVHNFFF